VVGRSKVRILFNFGREDELDPDAIRRLICSLSRALPPGEPLAAAAPAELQFLESRPLSGAWLLDGLWSRLGIGEIMARLLRGRRLDASAERALFALIANRALRPLSKLSCAAWVSERAAIPGLTELVDDQCYRAMDWLAQIEAELAQQVYWAVATLLAWTLWSTWTPSSSILVMASTGMRNFFLPIFLGPNPPEPTIRKLTLWSFSSISRSSTLAITSPPLSIIFLSRVSSAGSANINCSSLLSRSREAVVAATVIGTSPLGSWRPHGGGALETRLRPPARCREELVPPVAGFMTDGPWSAVVWPFSHLKGDKLGWLH